MTKTQRRRRLQEVLEEARKKICAYQPSPIDRCDCKKGLVGPQHFSDSIEMTGCPEIRDMIRLLDWEE
jgi:hypothetical protein